MKTKLASNLSCIEVSFQSEKPGLEDGVKVDFLKTLMETEAYLELRSKQQLGYHVWVGLEGDDGLELSYNLLAIQVQGEKDTDYVEGKINHFLLQYRVIILLKRNSNYQCWTVSGYKYILPAVWLLLVKMVWYFVAKIVF
jgi:secreted Zn-dependent insulinase-like peptidase